MLENETLRKQANKIFVYVDEKFPITWAFVYEFCLRLFIGLTLNVG